MILDQACRRKMKKTSFHHSGDALGSFYRTYVKIDLRDSLNVKQSCKVIGTQDPGFDI
jgi:hypothetical protein